MKTKNAYRLAQHLAYGDLKMFLAKAGGLGGGGWMMSRICIRGEL